MTKQAENDNEVISEAYVDQFHHENEQSRRDLRLSFYNEEVDQVKINQDNEFNDNKLKNLDFIIVNRNPSLDNELANKKYVDDSLGGNNILRYNQILEAFLELSVGKDVYNLTNYDKIQITDTTRKKLLTMEVFYYKMGIKKCNDKNENGKKSNFIKSTKTNSPTGDSGATSLPPIDDSFMYIETSSNNNGDNVFCSFERTDIIQISYITFYYNRFSARSTKSMGRSRIQLLLNDNTWSTRYNITKNDRYSDSSTDRTWLI